MTTTRVYYETDDMSSGLPVPLWMIIEEFEAGDWNSTYKVRLDAPFEAYEMDEMDPDVMAVSVPDHVYVRDVNDPLAFGIHLPSLRSYIGRFTIVSDYRFSRSDIRRLMLRIADLEDVLQYELRTRLQQSKQQR